MILIYSYCLNVQLGLDTSSKHYITISLKINNYMSFLYQTSKKDTVFIRADFISFWSWKYIQSLELTQTESIHCTRGKVTECYISISQSIHTIFNIFDLSDDDRNQIFKKCKENPCLTLISIGNYYTLRGMLNLWLYFFFVSKYVKLYVKLLKKNKTKKKNIVITILHHLRKKCMCLNSAWFKEILGTSKLS